jgi:hypothetical protein
MAIVQTEIFRRTIAGTPTTDEVNAIVDEVKLEVNAFMSGLLPDHVLALDYLYGQAGKYDPLTHYQIAITYLV